jgi:hypothetical protein
MDTVASHQREHFAGMDQTTRLEGPPNFPIKRAAAGLPANDATNCAICPTSK